MKAPSTQDGGELATYFANYDASDECASHRPVAEIFVVRDERFHGHRAMRMAECCYSGAMYDEARKQRKSLSCACLRSTYSLGDATNSWSFTEALLRGVRGSQLVEANADDTVGSNE